MLIPNKPWNKENVEWKLLIDNTTEYPYIFISKDEDVTELII